MYVLDKKLFGEGQRERGVKNYQCDISRYRNRIVNYIEFRLKAKTCRVKVRNKGYVDQMLFLYQPGGILLGGNWHRREIPGRKLSPAGKRPPGNRMIRVIHLLVPVMYM